MDGLPAPGHPATRPVRSRGAVASRLIHFPAVVLALLLPAAPVRAGDVVLGSQDMLERVVDPAAAAAPLPEGARVIMRSSHEPEGGNRDWGVWNDLAGRPPTYVRRDDGGYVLLDEQRPGCLTRMWFTAAPPLGNVDGLGRLQMRFDGEREPRVDVLATDFFAGRDPRFPMPLVGDVWSSSGGNFSYVPFCFARSLEVRVTTVPGEALWYQLNVLVLPHGAPVETFRAEGMDAAAAAARMQREPAPPATTPVVGERPLASGSRWSIVERSGAGSVRLLKFSVRPFTPATLAALELRVTVDDAPEPQIVVPLGALMGDGFSARRVRTPAFGMDPVAGRGYFALPIPFRSRLSAEIVAARAAHVRAEAHLAAPLPALGVLRGRQWIERSRRGHDFTVLQAPGAGRMAAWVLDVVGPPGSDRGPLQFFLEGDERVHVDRSPSPLLYGTGTEDAFNGGFYYNRGAFSLPTHGAGHFISRGDTRGARSQYRIFGGDSPLWEDGIRFGMEHGGGDEAEDQVTASTVFWYARPAALQTTDSVDFADTHSGTRHRYRGFLDSRTLTAYFEGERDGNSTSSDYPLTGGMEYRAPPPDASPEGVTLAGGDFRSPIAADLRIRRGNCGVILRRVLDRAAPSRVDVSVDGQRVGPWIVGIPNTAKRWLSEDFAVPREVTAGKRRIRVVMTPAGGPASVFGLKAMTRTHSGTGAPCRAAVRRPRIRLTVRPRRARAGRRVLLRFRATAEAGTAAERPLARVIVRLGKRRSRTGRRGVATLRRRFRRPGHYRAVACKPGHRCGATVVRVTSR